MFADSADPASPLGAGDFYKSKVARADEIRLRKEKSWAPFY